jgi:hypothetical protein
MSGKRTVAFVYIQYSLCYLSLGVTIGGSFPLGETFLCDLPFNPDSYWFPSAIWIQSQNASVCSASVGTNCVRNFLLSWDKVASTLAFVEKAEYDPMP